MIRPRIRLRLNPRGDSFSETSGVPVGGGVKDGLGEGLTGMGVKVGVCKAVAVAGGVTSRSNFC